MNLLLVDSVDFPFGGAHSVHVSLLMQGLRENNENAFLVIPYGRKREKLSANKKKYGHFDGIPYYFVKDSKDIKKGFRFIDNFLAVIKTARLIRSRHKHKKLDAVILGGIVDVIRDAPIIITCAIFRIPIYFWLVEKASLNEDFQGIAGFFNHKSQQLSEWLLPKFSSGLIVISSALKQHYLKYLPESKILINPILVSEEIYKGMNRESFEKVKEKMTAAFKGKRLLVYSGSFAEKDGLFYLIEAFAETVKKYPDTEFVMTGKSANVTLMDRVRDHIKKYNLEDKVKMVGFVNADELLCYNTMADALFVCRSNSPFANHGFPWKLGEYCMTAKPIIATRVGDIDKYFTDNETLFIVEPNNPAAIAKKIDYIFDHYEQSLNVAKNGRAVALREFGYLEKSKEVADFIKANQKK
ncbi:glycosyltransferase [Ferruginibacter sp. SUN106]|uniref:glycosyltransferase n=1 Tax=Ferruginibacter sp. SUN106 TaxID=2978348 RepID=UPI003D361881